MFTGLKTATQLNISRKQWLHEINRFRNTNEEASFLSSFFCFNLTLLSEFLSRPVENLHRSHKESLTRYQSSLLLFLWLWQVVLTSWRHWGREGGGIKGILKVALTNRFSTALCPLMGFHINCGCKHIHTCCRSYLQVRPYITFRFIGKVMMLMSNGFGECKYERKVKYI